MKTHTVILSLFMLPGPSIAQDYTIPWHTIDAGAGTSSVGPYTLSGAIGQPDASGPRTGGPYTLTGGFWPGAIARGGGCNDADINADGTLDFFDVSAFLTAFSTADPIADLNGDGLFNFFDVSGFLSAFAAGCP